jgi:hypothetical protein
MEHFEYAKSYRVKVMSQNGDSDHNIRVTEQYFDEERKLFQDTAIEKITTLRGDDPGVNKFHDWKTGMEYLQENKELFISFMINKGES